MTRLEQWQQVKNSEDGKLFAVENDGKILEAWEDYLSSFKEETKGGLIHDYLTFKDGYRAAAIIVVKATGVLA